MTFQKLHCALIAAACAGIVFCAAALSHATDFKMQKFKINEFQMQEFDMTDPYKSAQPKPSAKKKTGSPKSSKKRSLNSKKSSASGVKK